MSESPTTTNATDRNEHEQAHDDASASTSAAPSSTAPDGRRGRRGHRRDEQVGEARRDRGGPREFRDVRGRRIDLSPPRFNVDELAALAGAPLWQAVHAATLLQREDAVALVQVRPEGHAPLNAAVKPAELPVDAKPGDALRVRLLDAPKADGEVPTASVRQARDLDVLERLAKAPTDGVPGAIVREIKGGYSVALLGGGAEDIGDGAVRAFLPASQATLSRFGPGRADKVLGVQGIFDVPELDLERGNIVVSRKTRLLAQRDAEIADKLKGIAVDSVVQGTVTSIMPYGAFLDVGGLDALLHRDDLSWEGRGRIEQFVKPGKTVDVKVLSISGHKLKVGLKQLTPDPWAEVRAAFREGSVVEGVIVALADFGAFVKLPLPSRPTEHVEGLIHVSEISWNKVKHPSAKFQIGQTVQVKVLGLDTDERRMSLSTKALEKNPFEIVAAQFPVGTVVKAKVKSLAEFGAFIELSETVDGLVHIGEISWVDHLKHPSEALTIGQDIEAVVMNVDVGRQRVSCSIKRAQANPFDAWDKKYAAGTRHKLKVVRVEDKGATLDVEPGLSCFCSWRDLLNSEGSAVERAQDAVKMGQEIEVESRGFDRKFKKVSVSMKAVVEGDTRAAYDEYKKKEQGEQKLNPLAEKLKAAADKAKG